MHNIYSKVTLLPFALCALISCTQSGGRNTGAVYMKSEPEEENEIQIINTAKVAATSLLTNVHEIGLSRSAGRVTCLAIDKANSNHLIAGTATGGLWSSVNRGQSWSPINDQLPTLNIRSVCQNPLQPSIYYASTYTSMQTGASPAAYRPDIYKSTDGGKSFQLIPASAGTFSLVLKVVCSPVNQNTLYALSDQSGSNSGVYRSTDNGATFTNVLPLTNTVTDLQVFPDGSVLVSAGTTVVRSPNGNPGTFMAVNGLGGTHTFSSMSFAFCQNQPANVYAVSTGGNSGVGVFKSSDGGQNWSFLKSLPTGVFTRTLGVKPNNPAFFFAGSVGLYITQDAGNSFAFYGVGGVDWWSVNFDPNNADKVIITHDQGVKEVNLNPFNPNNNTAYVAHDSTLNCAQIYAGDYFPKGDKVIVGMQDLGTYQVYTGGEQSVASGDGASCFFNKQDTTIAYGCYQYGAIFKKTKINIFYPQPGFTQPVSILNQLDANKDGAVDEGAFFIHNFYVNAADGDQLYYPTKRRLWRSIDGGANWQAVSGYYDLTASFAEPVMDCNNKPNPIVYWTIADMLYIKPNAKTTGAGNEIKVKLPDVVKTVRLKPGNDSIVYVTAYTAMTGARIFRSSNVFKPNVQWTDLTGDMPDQIAVHCIEVNPKDTNQMIAGTGSGLYVSANGGKNWAREQQLPNVNILRTVIRPSDRRIFIFTCGRGAWAASFPAASGIAVMESAPEVLAWPNPTNGHVQVRVPEGSKNSSLRIFSADGRLQKSVANIRQSPADVDLSELPAGNYFLTLYEDSRRVRSVKIIRN